jgi:cation diffusion facilitator CzcD-associated flavoprotein CzcO
LGFSVHAFEAGASLGGVWHWNRYPGARVDCEVPYYQFTIPEVWRSWNWSERFPGHEELKRYFAHVDKVLDLSKDIIFSANVNSAVCDTHSSKWQVATEDGRTATCTYLICATGSLFKRQYPAFKNRESYKGLLHHSAFWPEDLDTNGKRIAIIGSGATGVQCVQEMAKTASHLTAYIRTASISLPIRQRNLNKEEQDQNKSIYKSIFDLARQTTSDIAFDAQEGMLSDAAIQERERLWEELWNRGGFNFQLSNFTDYI